MAEVATCGSEASTMTWIAAASGRASRRAKSGGMTTPTLAVPVVDEARQLVWLDAR